MKLIYVASGGCCREGGMKNMTVCVKSERLREVHDHVQVVEPCIW